MSFTLPPSIPADTILGIGYSMLWLGCTDDDGKPNVEVTLHNDFDGVLASGYGATPASAMRDLLSAFPGSNELRLPAEVAAALDELGHQAIDVVCQRLSGGTTDSATFAEADVLGRTVLDDIEQRFLKLLAEEEPNHPWVCKLRTPREGSHPRSMKDVLR